MNKLDKPKTYTPGYAKFRGSYKAVTLSNEVINELDALGMKLEAKLGFHLSYTQLIRYLVKNEHD